MQTPESPLSQINETYEGIKPTRFVSAIGAAALMGVSRQRFAQLQGKRSPRIPAADGVLNGNHEVWLESTIIDHLDSDSAEF